VASKVTVRHLLTHTGGTGDIFGPEFEQNRLKLREHGDYLKLYGRRGLTHEPGARFEYSNYGFVLLGALVEAVSGASYYDYVRDNVFRKAGMTATDLLPESERVPKRAVGYMRPYPAADWEPNTDTLPWRGTAAGGGNSTGGGAPGMNGELRVFPKLGYVVVSLSNLDPPAASRLVEFFALRMPDR
jgi:D-alanyl-D-alanine carboxypeptidase